MFRIALYFDSSNWSTAMYDRHGGFRRRFLPFRLWARVRLLFLHARLGFVFVVLLSRCLVVSTFAPAIFVATCRAPSLEILLGEGPHLPSLENGDDPQIIVLAKLLVQFSENMPLIVL